MIMTKHWPQVHPADCRSSGWLSPPSWSKSDQFLLFQSVWKERETFVQDDLTSRFHQTRQESTSYRLDLIDWIEISPEWQHSLQGWSHLSHWSQRLRSKGTRSPDTNHQIKKGSTTHYLSEHVKKGKVSPRFQFLQQSCLSSLFHICRYLTFQWSFVVILLINIQFLNWKFKVHFWKQTNTSKNVAVPKIMCPTPFISLFWQISN